MSRYEILIAKHVVYGKKDTPLNLREYKCPPIGGSMVGTRKDWHEIAKKKGFQAVEFVELDGSKILKETLFAIPKKEDANV